MSSKRTPKRIIIDEALKHQLMVSPLEVNKAGEVITVKYRVKPYTESESPKSYKKIVVPRSTSSKKQAPQIARSTLLKAIRYLGEPVDFEANSPIGSVISGVSRSNMIVVSPRDAAFGVHAYKKK